LFERLANWLESILLPCFYKGFLGIECPGCGMQSSFIELLRGDLYASLTLYPALTTTILLVVLLVVHLAFKLRHGALMLKILFLVNASIMVLHYIYKML
jgi:hypothetical protein